MKHRSQLLSLLLLLLLTVPLAAQSVQDALTIEVVDVPVFVTRGDQPVAGLSADDFELFVNGKPQAIDYFDVSGSSDASSLRERRMFVIVLDLAFSSPHSVRRAQEAAAEMIAKAPAGDLFAIATFSSRRAVWFATPFTSDRVALARGIGSLTSSKSGDPLAIVLTASERAAIEPQTGVVDRISGDAMRDIWHTQFARAAEHQILSFKDLADRLAALQGQKHVVVLSDGYAAQHPRFESFGVPYHVLQEMYEAFQSGDILLHTVDLNGVQQMRGSDSLRILSNGTGGQTVSNRNDLGEGLVELASTYRNGYLLGFKPGAVKAGHNRIEVKVKDLPRGTTVQYRKGFSGTPRQFDVNEGLYLADVVLNDVPQTGTAAALNLTGDKLEVRVPMRPLAAQLGMGGKAELMIYIFGADGVALGFHRQTIDVPSDATGEKTFSIEMPAGARVAKALLRVDDSLGFSRTGA